MPFHHTAADVLNRDFLEMRCRLLDLAAALDRIDRGEDAASARNDPRTERVRKAMQVLLDGHEDRAERVQMVFSDSYDAAWRESFSSR